MVCATGFAPMSRRRRVGIVGIASQSGNRKRLSCVPRTFTIISRGSKWSRQQQSFDQPLGHSSDCYEALKAAELGVQGSPLLLSN